MTTKEKMKQSIKQNLIETVDTIIEIMELTSKECELKDKEKTAFYYAFLEIFVRSVWHDADPRTVFLSLINGINNKESKKEQEE